MSYEVRNGKFYKVEEIDLTNLKKEVTQVLNFISQQEASIVPLVERKNAINNKKAAEIEKLNQEIKRISTVYDSEMNAYDAEIARYNEKISTATESLREKAEIIKIALPNEASKLVF